MPDGGGIRTHADLLECSWEGHLCEGGSRDGVRKRLGCGAAATDASTGPTLRELGSWGESSESS